MYDAAGGMVKAAGGQAIQAGKATIQWESAPNAG